MDTCEICNSAGKYISPLSTIRTCIDHVKYSNVGQPEVVQKSLGIISEYSDKMKKCQICESKLDDVEINSILENYKIITCNKHKEVSLWYQLDLAKLWYQFKNEFTEADYENLEHRKKFSEYRKQISINQK
ncbi:MAG TPA: hypothetical protein PK289_09470 [Bacteroidia bacterium]|nr:hypothetical protein [Bacteroidia bacterium]